MKNKNIIGILVMTSLVATSLAFAEEASVSGEVNANVNAGMMAPRPPMDGERAPERPRGFMKRIFDGGEGSNDQKFRIMGSTSDAKWNDKDFQKMRGDMQGLMASITANLTDAQKAAIAAKLGITIDVLKAKLASGTALQAIIAGKISRDDMMKIIPLMMAPGTGSTTMMMRDRDGDTKYDQKPRKGFFNSLTQRLFGGGENLPKESMEANIDVNINSSTTVQTGFSGFLKRFFHF